ncbi:MAG TPA: heparan-alpha-glucosaminide N-acetyltransferase [Paracoccaceae bacterium]|nr:heparan-alpha-glucosaminide N-acetyltransferase [Paracoccaceae bacterium]
MATDRPSATRRIVGLDIARSVALLAMASYHFCYDLEAFGYLPPGTMVSGWGAIFARAIAASFLFLVGIGLYLAHGRGIRWRPFWGRFAQIGAAAALITLATWYVQGQRFIFFGILHSIALSSLIGLAFLRLPALLTLIIAAGVWLAPRYLAQGAFDVPWLIWSGLTTLPVYAVDFVPTFPWLGPVLAGIGCANLAALAGLWDRPRPMPTSRQRWLSLPGQHSLIVYLIHQPILIGILWTLRQIGWF